MRSNNDNDFKPGNLPVPRGALLSHLVEANISIRRIALYFATFDRVSLYKLIVYLVALMFVGISVFYVVRSVSLLRSGTRAMAQCIQVTKTRTGRDETLRIKTEYVVKFQDLRGARQTARLEGAHLKEGSSIEIVYDPQNPTFIRAVTFWGLWGGSIMWLAAGVAAGLAGHLGFRDP